MSSNEPVKNGCEVIYETFHISLHNIAYVRGHKCVLSPSLNPRVNQL